MFCGRPGNIENLYCNSRDGNGCSVTLLLNFKPIIGNSVYEITYNEEYLRVCRQLADFIVEKAPITREGGLEHTLTEANGHFSEQMWADTLFMAVLFLAKMGAYDRRYADFAVNQLSIHLQYLFKEWRLWHLSLRIGIKWSRRKKAA